MSESFELLVPQMNPNDEHAVLVRWNVESGTQVAAGQSVATLETTKTAFDVEAPRGGYVFYSFTPKSLIPVGARLAWICDENSPPAANPPAAIETKAESGQPPVGDSRITRKALQLMREHGLSARDVSSSAARIEVADVERLIRQRGAESSGAPSIPDDCTALEQSPSKIIEIQALGQVYESAIPSLVALSLSCDRCDARLRGLSQQHGPLSLLELVIYESARLLDNYPDLNGFYSSGKAWRYNTVSVGFAINLGRSLRVPVVHRAAELSQVEIARSVRNLSLQYLRDELQLPDLTGGTFTVTDLSSQFIEHFVPVINLRQSAILGICAERPASGRRDLVLAFDHRMTDGMRAAGFLASLRERLEADPQG
jgi:pyruvate/2-oxoglutarate dehydrogenase complex dihydrolipoamide acyltransferase (E2) component